jgi:hypothetical protein
MTLPELARLQALPEAAQEQLVHPLACRGLSQQPWGDNQTTQLFMQRALARPRPRILELGTRRSVAHLSTRHDAHFPHAAEYLGLDLEAGVDVDIVADVHRLTAVTGCERFDIIVSDAGFEHFKYPHLAAHEVMKALTIGGLVFVQTHQTFPLHAVPHDYCRFSTAALRSLFGAAMGMQVHAAGYGSPAAIYSWVDPGSHQAPAFLHVNLFAEKLRATPLQYIYEYDCLV